MGSFIGTSAVELVLATTAAAAASSWSPDCPLVGGSALGPDAPGAAGSAADMPAGGVASVATGCWPRFS